MNVDQSSIESQYERVVKDLNKVAEIYYIIVIASSTFVSLFWIVYLSYDISLIKKKYKRILKEAPTPENNAILNTQKTKLIKNLTILLICISEITPAICVAVKYVLGDKVPPGVVMLFQFSYLFLVYLNSCLLNILTTHLISVYSESHNDFGKSCRTLLLKIALILLLSPGVVYIFIIPCSLIILLFIREFVQYVRKCIKLDRIIGWKEQDLGLECGNKTRVQGIKRMRRQYRRLNRLGICCISCLILVLPLGLTINFLRLAISGQSRDLIVQSVHALIANKQINKDTLELVIYTISFLNGIFGLPLSLLACVYILFTLHFCCGSTFRDINNKLYGCFRGTTDIQSRTPYFENI